MAFPQLTDAQKQHFITEGYVTIPSLLSPELAQSTKQNLSKALNITDDPKTWDSTRTVLTDLTDLTAPTRATMEAAVEQLVGPNLRRGSAISAIRQKAGQDPIILGGVPVFVYPQAGQRIFQVPDGWHIDGMQLATCWPETFLAITLTYLTDTSDYGGALTVRPRSHRQVFEHWFKTNDKGAGKPPELPYADPKPLAGKAGDVTIMHYLLVHSGSKNFSDHIRMGINTTIQLDPAHPYKRKSGPPQPNWTPLDHTLRTDTL